MNMRVNQSNNKGSATLVMIVLLGVMSMMLLANSRSLSHLKSHLDAVEQRQLKKFQPVVAADEQIQQDAVAPKP